MRRHVWCLPMVLLSACASACDVGRGLYSAVVQRSGAPPREELRRIRMRDTTMARGLARSRVVVLPVAVIGGEVRPDSQAAARLADRLVREGLAASARVGPPAPVPFERHPNEAMIFWRRWQALGAWVQQHPMQDADVVLLVDVFGRPERGVVGAVHAMATTGGGELGWSGFWNSHQPLYKEMPPHSADDATAMVATALARDSRAKGAPRAASGRAESRDPRVTR